MNILVLGNGFDLAHGLPTRYTDFLAFIREFKEYKHKYKSQKEIGFDNNDVDYVKYFTDLFKKASMDESLKLLIDELEQLVVDNFWIDYFLQNPMYQKENWIDFESEISKVVQSVDQDMKKSEITRGTIVKKMDHSYLREYFLEDLDAKIQKRTEEAYNSIKGEKMSVGEEDEYLKKYEEEHPIVQQKEAISYGELIDRLELDLNKLIRALEIYLSDYVSWLKIERKLSDIQELDIDHVLSFNYTDTYEKVYGKGKKIDYDYIHGMAKSDNTIDSNNMVLGIDEYLTDDRRNKDVEFIAFKKYYQRIYKQTGCEYKDWVDEIIEFENSKDYMHNLYIFGHSLDVTDRDILRDLILHDNVHTTIFYPDKKELGRKITNLVKVIGQDELIKRTGGSTKTIEFEPQQVIERK